MTRAVVALACLLTGVGLALVLPRIAQHAGAENVFEGPVRTLAEAGDAPALDLGSASLEAGLSVVFEVCAADRFAPSRWRGAAMLEVWHVTDGERIVASSLDDARLATVRRGDGVGCLELASAGELGVAGEYAIVARPEAHARAALAEVPVRGRIVVSRPMETRDLSGLLVLVGASLVWLVALALGPRGKSALERELGDEAPPPRRPGLRSDVRAAMAWVALALGLFGVGLLSFVGPFAAVLGSATLALVQLGAAFALASPGDEGGRRGVLALGLPTGKSRVLAALAPLAGLALVLAGRYAGAAVPSTSESAIETYVASRSGYLAVAASGVLLPIVEELFFRGLLYGLLARAWGATAATVVVLVAFPLLHLPQVAGAWGALASLAITGAGLTLLRRVSGSVVPPAIAHLAHNAVIALLGFPIS